MDCVPGHDGSALAEWVAGERAALEVSRDCRDHAPFADDFDCGHVTTWRPAPGALAAIPENYTPTYAYPLIVWLCEESASEAQVARWLSRISSRNYVALALRRDLHSRPATSTAAPAKSSVRTGLQRFSGLLRQVSAELRIHPERCYIAGSGSAGRTAIEWLLRRSDCFAGGIVVDVDRPAAAAWRMMTPGLCRQRLLWVETGLAANGGPEAADPVALRCIGLRVEEWRPVGTVGWPAVAARMNDWIMAEIPTAIVR